MHVSKKIPRKTIKVTSIFLYFYQRRGPQRSVDMIVSSSFILGMILVILMCVQVSKRICHFFEGVVRLIFIHLHETVSIISLEKRGLSKLWLRSNKNKTSEN